jgi:hypothetical protein
MARKLDHFPSNDRQQARRYPWDEWTDGGVWEIRQGDDYEIPTENMRVNLHIKADSKAVKVRTRKVRDDAGEGLIFQFYDPDGEEAKRLVAQTPASELDSAMELLYADAMNIYERARHEITIPRSDGTEQKYAAVRYKQQLEAVEDNKSLLVTVIASIIKKRTSGFDHLANAGRSDLMVERLVLDESKPYHRFFTKTTIDVARKRMAEFGGSNDK